MKNNQCILTAVFLFILFSCKPIWAAPQIQLFSPSPSNIVGKVHIIVKVTPPKSGYDSVHLVMLYPKGPDQTFKAGDAYEMDWDSTQVPNGIYKLHVDVVTNPVNHFTYMTPGSTTTAEYPMAVRNVQSSLPPKIELVAPSATSGSVSGKVHVIVKVTPPDQGYDKVHLEMMCGPNAPDKLFKAGDAYEMDWDSTQSPNGKCQLDVYVMSNQGGPFAQAIFPIVVNNVQPAPKIEFVSPLPPPTTGYVSGKARIIIKVTPPDKGYDSVRLAIFSGNGLDKTFRVGDAYETDWDTAQFPNGTAKLNVYVLQNQASVTYAQFPIEVNNLPKNVAPPNVKFLAPKDGDTVKGTVPVQVDATSDGGIDKIEIQLPSGEMAYPMKNKVPYSWNWDSTSVHDGDSNKIKATVCDKENHCASSEITVSVKNQ